MKPTVTMDGKHAVEVSEDAQAIRAKATSGRKLLIVGAVIGLVCLVVIAGVSIGAFYLGMNAERESAKEAWVNFKAGENRTIIKERVIVKEKEAEVRRPGAMNMVIDYGNNWLVMQYDMELQGDEEVYCYVYDYEPGMFGTQKDAERMVNGDETGLVDPKGDEKLKLEETGEQMQLEQLSPMAREMCYGATILRVRKTDKEVSEEDNQREKRWVRLCYTRYRCRRVCFFWWCRYVCRYYRFCLG